jgi:hypothetical protein
MLLIIIIVVVIVIIIIVIIIIVVHFPYSKSSVADSQKSTGLTVQAHLIHCSAKNWLYDMHFILLLYALPYSIEQGEIKQF